MLVLVQWFSDVRDGSSDILMVTKWLLVLRHYTHTHGRGKEVMATDTSMENKSLPRKFL